jgi:hypothetical protein
MPSSNEPLEVIGPPADPSIEGAFTAAELMADCFDDGSPSVTARLVLILKSLVPDSVWDHQDWARLARLTVESTSGPGDPLVRFLHAVESWQNAKMAFAISAAWGRCPSRAHAVQEIVQRQDPGEAGIRELLRLSPDEHLREMAGSIPEVPGLGDLIEKEWTHRHRQTAQSDTHRRVLPDQEWGRTPAGRLFIYWLRGGHGAPALCFWTWGALDALLYPSGDGIGSAPRKLAQRLRLKKGAESVRQCRVTNASVEVLVQLTAKKTGEKSWKWMQFPRDSYG